MKTQTSIQYFWALSGALVTLLLTSQISTASAQTWPTKTVKIVAPVAPGGGVDLVARTMAERLTKTLGQAVVVENLSGGGGAIAASAVARSQPDGYMLLLAYVATHGTSPATRKLPYDAEKDFTPIAMVGGTPNVLVVESATAKRADITGVPSFLKYMRSNPGKISFGSAGQGSLTHLAMEQLKQSGNFFAVHVPYRGIGPAFTDLMGGQTQLMMPGLAAALPHIRSGRLKPVAITGSSRHPLLPDVPTLQESGFKGFDGVQWYGIVGPAKLPASIVTRLNEEVNKAIQTSELKDRLASEALTTMPMSQEQFAQYIKTDIARWTTLVRERKIEIE
jgi:tripartite-type tricarboxylate transporter receptor subunit TctC